MQSQDQADGSTSRSSSLSAPKAATRSNGRPGYTTINDMVTDEKCPNKFRLEARIIDFYPPDPYDWVITHCVQCKEE